MLSAFTLSLTSQEKFYEFNLDTKKIGAPIQSTMYGLFFEDINFAADGGLYAELVKNRSFDFPQNLMGWYTFGKVDLRKDNPLFDRNPFYLILSDTNHPHKHTSIENEGFRGMGFKEDGTYRFSIWAKNLNPAEEQKIKIELISSENEILGSENIIVESGKWIKYQVMLTSRGTEEKGRLRIVLTSKGSIAIEHVSLFPTATFNDRENGLRADIAKALADINPGIFRFPGGCIVEGTDIQTRYDWKKSIGPVENRPLNENRWNYAFANRLSPDYFQSYGLGFFEYFQFAEDIGAEPLPVVNCGLACQFQNNNEHSHIPLGELDSFIQDALDLIEFANGPVTSKWGKIRTDMGHPDSFNLKYIGIGNEQWGKEYTERLEPFVKAIRLKYPNIKIVGSSGPSADGKEFDYLWPEMKRMKVDLVDEHYYKDPEWFLKSAGRYDNYDRKGPAVFAGEYACHMPDKANDFISALYEAAFMTGLERNADIVHMCTYAPLLAHVDAWQWKPDMIWFDNTRLVKTPNYYVQQLYAQNKGTHVVNLTMDNKAITGQEDLYASAVYDGNQKCFIIKIANTGNYTKKTNIRLSNSKKNTVFTLGDCTGLQSNDPLATNSLSNPNRIVPQKITALLTGNILKVEPKGQSFNVYKVRVSE